MIDDWCFFKFVVVQFKLKASFKYDLCFIILCIKKPFIMNYFFRTSLLISLIFLLGSYKPINEKDTKNSKRSCQIKFISLECKVPEGYASADAIYFKINGQKWPKSSRFSMSAGSYKDLRGYIDLSFNGSITIELWDDDTFDSDDFLGSKTVSCRYDSNGMARFTGDGADYILNYIVN